MNRFLASLLVLGPVWAVGCASFTEIGESGGGAAASGDTSGGGSGESESGGSAGSLGGGSGGSKAGTGNAGGRAGTTGGGSSNAGSGGRTAGTGGGVSGAANSGGSGGSAGLTTGCDDASDCVLQDIACLDCPNGDPACPTFLCVEGQCTASFPTCVGECGIDDDCPVSLAPCQLCPDGSSACPWSLCVDGQCQSGIDTCEGVDPCEGKSCGDECVTCSGTDCPAVPIALMFCDETLTCQTNLPQCEPPPDPCGGCTRPEICIYQVGGPGPSQGFKCVYQAPCGAAAAPCSCIYDEGTCTYVQGTADESGYCSCDNGLE